MFIRQNGLTITVIIISITAVSLIVAFLFISFHVLAEIPQKMGNSILNTLPTTTGHMYTVTLNNFFVNHTRSHSMDTDYISMGVQSACDRVNWLFPYTYNNIWKPLSIYSHIGILQVSLFWPKLRVS